MVAAAFPAITRRLPRSATAVSSLRVRYLDGRGVLRQLLQVVTSHGFTIDEVSTDMAGRRPGPGTGDGKHLVGVTLQVYGKESVNDLAAALSEVSDVDGVLVDDANAVHE
jgi:putative Mg2+ transporter-C (MgtC) family protein